MAVLIEIPILLGFNESPGPVPGAVIVMRGTLTPLRRGFGGLTADNTLIILVTLGLSEGLVTPTHIVALQG